MGKMKFSWKARFLALLVFGFIRANGQVETTNTSEPLLRSVDVGNSTGSDLNFEIGSTASFGCSYSGTFNVTRMKWIVLTVLENPNGYEKSFMSDLWNGSYSTQTYNHTGVFNHVESIIKIPNVRPLHDQMYMCIFIFDRTEENHVEIGLQGNDLLSTLTFRVRVYSLPTAVYVNEIMRDPFNSEYSGDWTFEMCCIKNIYPEPDKDSIGLYSRVTGQRLELDPTDKDYQKDKAFDDFNVKQNDIGLYDVYKVFIVRPSMTDHLENYVCIVNVKIGNTTISVKSHNSTVPILISNPTKRVNFNIHPNPVAEGEKVTLTCKSDGYSYKPMQIYRTNSNNVSKIWQSGNTSSFLIEFTANRTMNGKYTCESNYIYTEVNLIVTWKSHFISLWKDGDLYVDDRAISIAQGENLTLNCVQEGNPHPLTTWDVITDTMTNYKFDKWKSRIVIKNATLDDAGIYRCSSSHGLQRQIKVVVATSKPHIIITGSKLSNGSATLNVTCIIEDNNSTCILKIGTEYDNVTESLQINKTSSISKIYHLRKLDEDKQFWCKASNSIGVEFSTVYKSVDELPTIPDNNDDYLYIVFGLIAMIVIGGSCLLSSIYSTHRCWLCPCIKSCLPGNKDRGVEEPTMDEIELEPINRTEQLQENCDVPSIA